MNYFTKERAEYRLISDKGWRMYTWAILNQIPPLTIFYWGSRNTFIPFAFTLLGILTSFFEILFWIMQGIIDSDNKFIIWFFATIFTTSWTLIGIRIAKVRVLAKRGIQEEGLTPTKNFIERRLLDKGKEKWAWSLAHLVPFLWIYYAFSRRTFWPYILSTSSIYLLLFIDRYTSIDSNALIIIQLFLKLTFSAIGISITRKRGLAIKRRLEEAPN